MNSMLNMEALSATSPIETTNTVYFYIFIVIMASLIYDKRKQGFHDKIARTFVIKVNKKLISEDENRPHLPKEV